MCTGEHLIANEIAYHTGHTSPSYQLPKLTSNFGLLSQDYCSEHNTLGTFFTSSFTSFYECWQYYHPWFFLFILALRIICYWFRIYCINASICQSVVLCQPAVTVMHIHISVRRCLNVWQCMPPDLVGYSTQSYDQVRKWIRSFTQLG